MSGGDTRTHTVMAAGEETMYEVSESNPSDGSSFTTQQNVSSSHEQTNNGVHSAQPESCVANGNTLREQSSAQRLPTSHQKENSQDQPSPLTTADASISEQRKDKRDVFSESWNSGLGFTHTFTEYSEQTPHLQQNVESSVFHASGSGMAEQATDTENDQVDSKSINLMHFDVAEEKPNESPTPLDLNAEELAQSLQLISTTVAAASTTKNKAEKKEVLTLDAGSNSKPNVRHNVNKVKGHPDSKVNAKEVDPKLHQNSTSSNLRTSDRKISKQSTDSNPPKSNQTAVIKPVHSNGDIKAANGDIKRDATSREKSAKARDAGNANDKDDEKQKKVLAEKMRRKTVGGSVKSPPPFFDGNVSQNKNQKSPKAPVTPPPTAPTVPFQGRPAHKSHSMQSLAVPLPGTGSNPTSPRDGDAEDGIPIGERRDSIRQSTDSLSRKSVDFRLQSTHAVVAAAGSEEKSTSVPMHDNSLIRAAIPVMPLPLAIVCLILNILVPGLGTAISGLSIICCSKSRLSSKGDAVSTTLCVNVWVGAAQLGTVTFLLVGWFWSLAWGVKMVLLALKSREEERQQREKELQTLALRAFGSPSQIRRSILPSV